MAPHTLRTQYVLLQWGLDLSVEEGRQATGHRSSPNQLQWGLDLSVEEGIDGSSNPEMIQPLQWGLDLSVEEGEEISQTPQWQVWLQWGLDLSVEEGRVGLSNPRSGQRASMGPRPFSRGRFPCELRKDLVIVASMGPRPFSRGRMFPRSTSGVRDGGFNGASTFQSRKVRAS